MTGTVTEIATRRSAINPSAVAITVRNIIVEKYASPVFVGVLGGQFPAKQFVVDDCEARLNHGDGIVVGFRGIIRRTYMHHNGKSQIK